MKSVLAVLLAVILLPSVLANVLVSEVMYNPYPSSDTEAEWVELYNDGLVPVDLSAYTLNGAHLASVMQPSQYTIVARKLVSSDNSTSFESLYGDNDGVWNDGFAAIQTSMSLVDEGVVVLATSEGPLEILNYSSAWGGKNNGYSLYRKDLTVSNVAENWAESLVLGGSPGRGEENTLHLSFVVESSQIVVANKTITDDFPELGYQVIPSPGVDRPITLKYTLDSATNPSGIVTFQDVQVPLQVSDSTLSATLNVPYSLAAGNYSISVHMVDGSKALDDVITFEVMSLLALQTSTNSLDFGQILQNQTSSEKLVTLRNTGNTVVNAALSASNFTSGSSVLAPGIISVTTESGTTPLDYSTNLALNLIPGSAKDVNFIANIPVNAPVGAYVGAVSVVGKP